MTDQNAETKAPNNDEHETDQSQCIQDSNIQCSYHDSTKTTFGCEHYMRNCYMKADCCGEWFVCRRCHDKECDPNNEIEFNDVYRKSNENNCNNNNNNNNNDNTKYHKINRYLTKYMKCMQCGLKQICAQYCINCDDYKMAHYYCNICKFWDNDVNKNIFHCDKCKMCRIGIKDDFIHCDTCNACLHKSYYKNHNCVQESLNSQCPVCFGFLFNSTDPVAFWEPCGHPIHLGCFNLYIQSNHYRCAICRSPWKSIKNSKDVNNDDLP
mmetsp:Transcript_106243/g.129561  ORF Transcript_106243/g.129561 Transcript_106243/m.129561 type:complete len:267 (-) Transcript_106243:29-829(-)